MLKMRTGSEGEIKGPTGVRLWRKGEWGEPFPIGEGKIPKPAHIRKTKRDPTPVAGNTCTVGVF